MRFWTSDPSTDMAMTCIMAASTPPRRQPPVRAGEPAAQPLHLDLTCAIIQVSVYEPPDANFLQFDCDNRPPPPPGPTPVGDPPVNHRLILLTAASLLSSLGAAELSVADLRLGLDLRPTDFDFEASNQLGTVSGSDSFDTGFGASLRGLYGFGRPGAALGLVVGGEVTTSWHQYDGDSDYRTYGMRALAGIEYHATENWAFDLLGYGGFGYAEFEVADNELFDGFTSDGYLGEYGLLLGSQYRLSRHWLVQAELGWTQHSAELEGDAFDITLEQFGPTAFLGFSYRFGGLPPALE